MCVWEATLRNTRTTLKNLISTREFQSAFDICTLYFNGCLTGFWIIFICRRRRREVLLVGCVNSLKLNILDTPKDTLYYTTIPLLPHKGLITDCLHAQLENRKSNRRWYCPVTAVLFLNSLLLSRDINIVGWAGRIIIIYLFTVPQLDYKLLQSQIDGVQISENVEEKIKNGRHFLWENSL